MNDDLRKKNESLLDKALKHFLDGTKSWWPRLEGLPKYHLEIADLLVSKVIEDSPENEKANYIRSCVRYFLGRGEEALLDCNKAIELGPKTAWLTAWFYDLRSLVLNGLGRYEEALLDCNKVIELDPNKLDPKDAEFYDMRSLALNGLGRYEEALADINNAIRLNPHNAVYHNNRGWTLNHLGRYIQAIPDLERAIQLDNTFPNPHAHLGNAYLALGKQKQARNAYEKALEHHKQHHKPENLCPQIQAERGLRALGIEPGTNFEKKAIETGRVKQKFIDDITRDLDAARAFTARAFANS